MKTKNGHILTFSEKMQISAISCFATCDWFCPMTSQIYFLILTLTWNLRDINANKALTNSYPYLAQKKIHLGFTGADMGNVLLEKFYTCFVTL